MNITGTHRLRGQIGAVTWRLEALAISAKLLVCFLLQAPAPQIQLGTVSFAATGASDESPLHKLYVLYALPVLRLNQVANDMCQ